MRIKSLKMVYVERIICHYYVWFMHFFYLFLFKNHFWPKNFFVLLRETWLPRVHCILVLFLLKFCFLKFAIFVIVVRINFARVDFLDFNLPFFSSCVRERDCLSFLAHVLSTFSWSCLKLSFQIDSKIFFCKVKACLD